MQRIKWILGVLLSVIVLSCTACTKEETKVVLTTGLKEGDLFRMGDSTCLMSEGLLYYVTLKNEYEAIYGTMLWEQADDSDLLLERLNEITLTRLAKIKSMNLLGKEYNLTLTDDEKYRIDAAATKFIETLSPEEVSLLQVDQKLVSTIYQEYYMADKVYSYMIKDINPEISDDEARIVTIHRMSIAFETDSQKENAHQQAAMALGELNQGDSFEEVASRYNDMDGILYSFDKEENLVDPQVEEIAFSLGTGEISQIIELENAYEILQCVNTLDREETEANKIRIMEMRRNETFQQEYESFVNRLVKHIDYATWEKATSEIDPVIKTTDLFTIYHENIISTHS